MPCNSDCMKPTTRERQRKEAAQLLLYVLESLDVSPVSSELIHSAKDVYGGSNKIGDKWVVQLCDQIHAMTDEQVNKIVYNGRDPMSRRLADWWDEHQEQDRIRKEAEAQKQKMLEFDDMSREDLVNEILKIRETAQVFKQRWMDYERMWAHMERNKK